MENGSKNNAKVLRALQIAKLKDTIHDMSEVVGEYFSVIQMHYLARVRDAEKWMNSNDDGNGEFKENHIKSVPPNRLSPMTKSTSMGSLGDMIRNYYTSSEHHSSFFFLKSIKEIVTDQGHLLLTSYAGATKGPLIHRVVFHVKKENVTGSSSPSLGGKVPPHSLGRRRTKNRVLYIRQTIAVVSPETLATLMEKYSFGKRSRTSSTAEASRSPSTASSNKKACNGGERGEEKMPLTFDDGETDDKRRTLWWTGKPVLALLKDYTDAPATPRENEKGTVVAVHKSKNEDLKNFKLFNSYERIIFESEMALLQRWKAVFTHLLDPSSLPQSDLDHTVEIPMYFVYIAAHDSAATRLKVVSAITHFCIDFVTNSNFSSEETNYACGDPEHGITNLSQRLLYYNTVILQVLCHLSSHSPPHGRTLKTDVTEGLSSLPSEKVENVLSFLLQFVEGVLEEVAIEKPDGWTSPVEVKTPTIRNTTRAEASSGGEEKKNSFSIFREQLSRYFDLEQEKEMEGEASLDVLHLQPPSTLIHCLQGVSRSASVVILYFMQTYSKFLAAVRNFERTHHLSVQTDKSQLVSYAGLLEAVQSLRPVVRPNVCFAVEILSLWKRWIEEGHEVK